MKNKSIGFIIGAAIVLVAAVAAAGLITKVLWNKCLVPAIDSVNTVTYLQALGIYVLANILFKNVNLKSSNAK